MIPRLDITLEQLCDVVEPGFHDVSRSKVRAST
jgi:hypothetical protein